MSIVGVMDWMREEETVDGICGIDGGMVVIGAGTGGKRRTFKGSILPMLKVATELGDEWNA